MDAEEVIDEGLVFLLEFLVSTLYSWNLTKIMPQL